MIKKENGKKSKIVKKKPPITILAINYPTTCEDRHNNKKLKTNNGKKIRMIKKLKNVKQN